MIFFYVAGGGFGHLKRVHRFLTQTGTPTQFRVLTHHPWAGRYFGADNIVELSGTTASEWRKQVTSYVSQWQPKEFFVDTFPSGLLGELNQEILPAKVNYIARRLKWQAYTPLVVNHNIRFTTTYVVEELEELHAAFIHAHSDRVVSLDLTTESKESKSTELSSTQPVWLIVHTSRQEEVESLLEDAIDIAQRQGITPRFLLCTDVELTQNEPNMVERVPFEMAAAWFSVADRIFCGGGFNTLLELKQYRDKVRAVPFPRQYDDQAWRVARFYER